MISCSENHFAYRHRSSQVSASEHDLCKCSMKPANRIKIKVCFEIYNRLHLNAKVIRRDLETHHIAITCFLK